MQAILKFSLPEEQDEYETCVGASKNAALLWDLEQEVFRPARKHGYRDRAIQTLIEKLDVLVETYGQLDMEWPKDEYGLQNATDLISMLEKLYYELKNED